MDVGRTGVRERENLPDRGCCVCLAGAGVNLLHLLIAYVEENCQLLSQKKSNEEVEGTDYEKFQGFGTSQETVTRAEEGGAGFLQGHDRQEGSVVLP